MTEDSAVPGSSNLLLWCLCLLLALCCQTQPRETILGSRLLSTLDSGRFLFTRRVLLQVRIDISRPEDEPVQARSAPRFAARSDLACEHSLDEPGDADSTGARL